MKPSKLRSPLSIYLEIGGIVVGTKTDLNVQTKQEISLSVAAEAAAPETHFHQKTVKTI